MNVNEIQDLIKFVAKAGVNEVEIEKKDFKIVIKSDYMAKKKTNFKEETKIVQQISPVSTIPPPIAQPQIIAEPTAPVEKKREGTRRVLFVDTLKKKEETPAVVVEKETKEEGEVEERDEDGELQEVEEEKTEDDR